MKTSLIRSTYDRKTGKKIKEDAVDYIEMEEDKYYDPIVKLIGDELLKNQINGGKHGNKGNNAGRSKNAT